MSDRRWASSGLVRMLIHSLKDYKSAAEVISGADDVFNMSTRKIGAAIEGVKADPSRENLHELQLAVSKAREEIEVHTLWQGAVLNGLPAIDDEEGLTGPVRQSFVKTGTTRAKLLMAVFGAEKYLKE